MTEFTPHELNPDFDSGDVQALGSTIDLTNCDREPIHLSGAIQPHGVLLGVAESDLNVQRVSANTRAHLGVEPSGLLGAPLSQALGEEAAERLRVALADPHATGADPLACQPPGGGPAEMTWHRIGGRVLVELEPPTEVSAQSESGRSEAARRSVASLRALVALQAADDVHTLCSTAAVEVKRLTGYDRVMIYRFHPDGHGEVVAEQHEPQMLPFLGLHYPASDIPRQARRLYLLNHLRVIADVDYEPVPLLGAPGDGQDAPVDLSLAGLRSVSPVHLAYLRTMGVQATLTMSLMRGTHLWGMIACHHRTARRIDAQLRGSCRLLAQVFSQAVVDQEEVEHQAYRSRLADIRRRILPRISAAQSLAGALGAGHPSPLELTAAEGMVARIDGRTVRVGSVPPEDAVASLVTWLCVEEVPSELVCDDLPHRLPEFAPFAEQAAGVLALPLTPAYRDYVLWFRGEWVRTVRWAGDPDHPMNGDPGAAPGDPASVLSPRQSFAAWVQEVRGRCRPWLPAEVETARALAGAIPEIHLAQERNRLAHRTRRDPLTGLPNRALILAQTARALQQQEAGGSVGLLVVDLDHFGQVNESLGRPVGDQLVRQAAQRLATAIGERDVLAHAGGDDFIVLCEGTTVDQAARLADVIVEDFRTPFAVAGREILATVSIGVAVADHGANAADLLSDAGTAMSRMKQWGRNGAVPFYP